MAALNEMTTAELTTLKAEVEAIAREQYLRLAESPSRGLEESYGRTRRFGAAIDDELWRRGA